MRHLPLWVHTMKKDNIICFCFYSVIMLCKWAWWKVVKYMDVVSHFKSLWLTERLKY